MFSSVDIVCAETFGFRRSDAHNATLRDCKVEVIVLQNLPQLGLRRTNDRPQINLDMIIRKT
jgi:hypothetical protein